MNSSRPSSAPHLLRRLLPSIIGMATVSLAALLACGDSEPTPGAQASNDSGGGTEGSADTGVSTSGLPKCADYGGTCQKLGVTGTCAAGALRVAGSLACPMVTPDCCVPRPANGGVPLSEGFGLVCSEGGKYPALVGTCGMAGPCELGCECTASKATATCDCSRGLTPVPKGQERCELFSCGVISCGIGCTCADPAKGACACP